MHRYMKVGTRSVLAFAALAAGTLAAGEPPVKEAPPVQKVILYKHGMGYIERRGKIDGDAMIDLNFRAEQMKDLLTSFFAVDLGGGKIASVQYETKDTLSKQLEGILIRVPEGNALSQFLMQLKGASLTAKAAGETVQGRILGVEPVNQIIDNKQVNTGFRLVLMTGVGTIRSLDLFSIAEFTLDDPELQRDLNRLLTISLDSKYTNRKKMRIVATGAGERELRIGYLVEMPIWKASYRVILDAKNVDAESLLQGWALAENTTEDDWNEVDIAFVAGSPLSYIMDLYSPFYIQRPHVPIPGLDRVSANWSAAPEPSMLAAAKDKAERKRDSRAQEGGSMELAAQKAGAPMAPGAAMAAPAAEAEQDMADLLQSSMSTAAKGVSVGELFSYQGQQKVSIKRGQAAMVPIISQQVKGQRLLYYKAAFSPRPANAYVLKNETELTFEAGAVTFFESDTALGEGILAHTLAPGGKEVLPYAIDGSVDVTPEVQSQHEPAYKGSIVNGVATLTLTEKVTNTWKLTNRGKKDGLLWIDQPKNFAYKLVKPEKPLEEVEGHYRFEVALKAGAQQDLVVEEQREIYQQVYLTNSDVGQLRFLLAQKFFSEPTKAFLNELVALMNQRTAKQQQLNEWNRQIQQLSEEQNRLRNNMGSLNTGRPQEAELRAKWVTRLGAAEDELIALRGKLDAGQQELQKLEVQLGEKIRSYKGE